MENKQKRAMYANGGDKAGTILVTFAFVLGILLLIAVLIVTVCNARQSRTLTVVEAGAGANGGGARLRTGSQEVQELETAKDMREALHGEAPVIVLMYADWCGHCAAMKPDFAKLAGELDKSGIKFAQVESAKVTGMGKCEGAKGQLPPVRGYPMLVHTLHGTVQHKVGRQSYGDMMSMVAPAALGETAAVDGSAAQKPSELTAAGDVMALLDGKGGNGKEAALLVYGSWCGWSKKMLPEFEKAAKTLNGAGVSTAQVESKAWGPMGGAVSAKYGVPPVRGFPTVLTRHKDGSVKAHPGYMPSHKVEALFT